MFRAPTALCALMLVAAAAQVPAQTPPPDDTAKTSTAKTTTDDAPASEPRNTDGDFWRLVGSPYTYHFSNDPDHEAVYAIGLERQRSDKWFWGGTYFSNSFGQPSVYLYFGQRYGKLFDVDQLFAQWSAGLLYGYKEPYEDKVPFNYNGFSPGAVFSLGWQFTREFSMQANLLGTAALMIQLSLRFSLRPTSSPPRRCCGRPRWAAASRSTPSSG